MSNEPYSKARLGDAVFAILQGYQNQLLRLGRAVQLSHEAFQRLGEQISQEQEEFITLNYALGLGPDGRIVPGTHQFEKQELIDEVTTLREVDLSTTGIYHLVSFTEVLFNDLVAEIVAAYPKKLGSKKTITASVLFDNETLDEARASAIELFCNELSYKSPKDYAEAAEQIFGFSLLEVAHFQRYLEIKATRDALIHNRGVANALYVIKSGSHARVRAKHSLPVSPIYYMQSYENCHGLAEQLKERFNEVFPSDDFRAWKDQYMAKAMKKAEEMGYLQRSDSEQSSAAPNSSENAGEQA